MPDKIFLGRTHKDYALSSEMVFLTKHSWDCGWYWGFGYVGNRDLHMHFKGAFLGQETNINNIFEITRITQKQWWVLRDLFVQAYALKEAAEVYRYGGHQTTVAGVTDMIRDPEMCTRLNKDLKTVLDKIWEIMQSTVKWEG